jgi:hypothetical protein
MDSLAFIEIEGSPAEAGRELGRFGAAAVHRHLVHTEAWHSVMRLRGSPFAAELARQTEARFPRVWSELQGLAMGLALPFEDVFLWNCRGDLWAMSPDGCTTVQLPGLHERRIAHNEDGDPGFANDCALAQCCIEGSPDFAAFVYPGSLPGHTFAVTDAGLAVTVNNLRQRQVAAGVPRMVLTRALLDTVDLESAVALLQDTPRSGGFHLTLAHCAHRAILSVEYSAWGCSVREVTRPSLHANHAIHPEMAGFPQIVTPSSGHRQARGNLLIEQARATGHVIDPLPILADQGDELLPIYRADPDDPDDENTLASTLITVKDTHVEWAVHEHPGARARYRMIDGHRQTSTEAHD